ncbi:MAG: hypothetical protein JW722_01095 [Demequinaceae bacterium]|nr:hypothetical protein [Demequinaceae bacterium]
MFDDWVQPVEPSEAVPESLALEIPGSIGTVEAVRLRGDSPWVMVNGEPASKTAAGAFRVPMFDGSTEIIKIKAFIPGCPTITWGKTTLYRAPGASAWVALLAVLAAAAGIFAGIVLIPGYVTSLFAIAAAIGSVVWMSRDHRSALGRFGPVVLGIAVLVAVGFVGLVL